MSGPKAEIDSEERADAGNGARPLALASAIASLAGVVATAYWAERWNAITITLVVALLWAAAVAAVDALVVLRRHGPAPAEPNGRGSVTYLMRLGEERPDIARTSLALAAAAGPVIAIGDAAPRGARRPRQPPHPGGRRADDDRGDARCGGPGLDRSRPRDLGECLSARRGLRTRGRAAHRRGRLGSRQRAHVQHRPLRAGRTGSVVGPRAARRARSRPDHVGARRHHRPLVVAPRASAAARAAGWQLAAQLRARRMARRRAVRAGRGARRARRRTRVLADADEATARRGGRPRRRHDPRSCDRPVRGHGHAAA